jgi:hypothetical protein
MLSFKALPILGLLVLPGCGLFEDKGPLSLTISTGCVLEAVNEKSAGPWTAKPGVLKLSGWMVDSVNKSTPETVNMQLVNSAGAVVALANAKRAERPDVVAHFKEPNFKKAGISAELDATKLPAGEYTFSAVMSQGHAITYCPLNAKLAIQ